MPVMSATRTPQSAPSTARRRSGVALAVTVAVLAAVGFAAWWFFFRDDAPPPVDIQTATSGLEDEATGTVDGVEGTWVVDRSVVAADGQGSFVGFRVDEELAQGIGHNTVVARTGEVDGEVVIDGTTVPRADVTADLRTLATDDDRRDNRMREAIAAEQFPDGTFSLTAPVEIGEVEEGQPVRATAAGELTIKGVTAPVTVDVEAQLVGDVVTVVGSGPIVFADHQVTAPTAPIVLSVQDHGVLELQLHLRRG